MEIVYIGTLQQKKTQRTNKIKWIYEKKQQQQQHTYH